MPGPWALEAHRPQTAESCLPVTQRPCPCPPAPRLLSPWMPSGIRPRGTSLACKCRVAPSPPLRKGTQWPFHLATTRTNGRLTWAQRGAEKRAEGTSPESQANPLSLPPGAPAALLLAGEWGTKPPAQGGPWLLGDSARRPVRQTEPAAAPHPTQLCPGLPKLHPHYRSPKAALPLPPEGQSILSHL